jgi:hypothetical protein
MDKIKNKKFLSNILGRLDKNLSNYFIFVGLFFIDQGYYLVAHGFTLRKEIELRCLGNVGTTKSTGRAVKLFATGIPISERET